MRVLGIETSSRRGSVALVEVCGDQVLVAASHCHEVPNAHGEQLLPLLDRVLSDAGWQRGQLDRVCVGLGPGSFTGLRVGIALGQGIALGLDRPLVGVGSLAAMAAAAPESAGPRAALLDARRDEVFLAVYGPNQEVLQEPQAVPRAAVHQALGSWPGPDGVILGEVADALDLPRSVYGGMPRGGAGTELPHAEFTARVGATLDPAPARVLDPLYIRPADAVVPALPPSPLLEPRSGGGN